MNGFHGYVSESAYLIDLFDAGSESPNGVRMRERCADRLCALAGSDLLAFMWLWAPDAADAGCSCDMGNVHSSHCELGL